MLFKGPYRIRKVLPIKSNELNIIFVIDIMTWSDWMRTLKYDKEVCKPRDFTISTELFIRLVITVVISHLVLGSQSRLLSSSRSVVTGRNPLEETLSSWCN